MNENNVVAVEKAAECTQELMKFGYVCYRKGFDNALIAGGVGVGIGVLACVAGLVLAAIDEKLSKKKETDENEL